LSLDSAQAQTVVTTDDLFTAARIAVFEEKNNEKARQLAKQALSQSPDYADVEVFLGRLYSWNKNYDSAAFHFKNVLTNQPANQDASSALIDLEYWNDHNYQALLICNKALSLHKDSEQLLLKKAKILNSLKQYKEAALITDQLLKSNPGNTAALALASSLQDVAAVNKIDITYDYSHFDNRYNQPWHLLSLSYSRQTVLGSVIARINYANRFGSNGIQGEVDAYPRISKTFYSYVNFGYSGSDIFPKYRAGFSLYANLPLSYEAEAGIRYLNFGTATYIYTASLSKYYSNFWFGARTYITPGTIGTSQSFSIYGRYYLKTADDYFGASLGTGLSPDDRIVNIQLNTKEKLTSRQVSLSFNHRIALLNIISLRAGIINQEYRPFVKGNQLDLTFGYQRRF
jgi:YaiO family outer membrane protein